MVRKLAKGDVLVCSCNDVPRSVIEAAMQKGACTMAAIFDATWAGCGPCGGTCQPEIAELLRAHLERLAQRQRRGEGS